MEGATTIKRNGQIGGHAAGQDTNHSSAARTQDAQDGMMDTGGGDDE